MKNAKYLNLIKLAKKFEQKSMYHIADKLTKIAAFGEAEPSLGISDNLERNDPNNPLNAWMDPTMNAAYKGMRGSGTFTVSPDFMKSPRVPDRFKGMTFDDAMTTINYKLPVFDPKFHNSISNYLYKVIPEFIRKPENIAFFKDAELLLSYLNEDTAGNVLSEIFSDDPETDRLIKENLKKLLGSNMNLSSALQEALKGL